MQSPSGFVSGILTSSPGVVVGVTSTFRILGWFLIYIATAPIERGEGERTRKFMLDLRPASVTHFWVAFPPPESNLWICPVASVPACSSKDATTPGTFRRRGFPVCRLACKGHGGGKGGLWTVVPCDVHHRKWMWGWLFKQLLSHLSPATQPPPSNCVKDHQGASVRPSTRKGTLITIHFNTRAWLDDVPLEWLRRRRLRNSTKGLDEPRNVPQVWIMRDKKFLSRESEREGGVELGLECH